MTTRQDNKLNMYRANIQICNANKSVWQKIPAFVKAFKEFESIADTLSKVAKTQERDLTGFAQSKEDLQNIMAEKGSVIAGAIYAYADEQGKKELRSSVRFSKSSLAAGSGNAAARNSQFIVDTANENINDLADYGIDPEDVAALQKGIEDFSSLLAMPRTVTASKKEQTDNLVELFIKADSLQTNRLDRVARQFKSLNPKFYAEYKNSREIIDLGSRFEKKKSVV